MAASLHVKTKQADDLTVHTAHRPALRSWLAHHRTCVLQRFTTEVMYETVVAKTIAFFTLPPKRSTLLTQFASDQQCKFPYQRAPVELKVNTFCAVMFILLTMYYMIILNLTPHPVWGDSGPDWQQKHIAQKSQQRSDWQSKKKKHII